MQGTQTMKLTILGCGNAFGTGGRLQTAFHVDTGGDCFLIDCGATALIGMERAGLDPARVSTILITHLHGDHFAGLVWWLLHAQYIARRAEPLTLAGPPGLRDRLAEACSSLYGSALADLSAMNIRFVDLTPGPAVRLPDLAVEAQPVIHPSGGAAFALRISTAGRTVAFSGDTEWTDALIDVARDADVFLCECSTYDRPIPSHLDWQTLEPHLPQLGACRIVLTHMDNKMFANRDRLSRPGLVFAEDGMVLEL